MQFSEANLNAIEQVARAAIATHPEQEGTDVFDNSDVLELVGELRAERTRTETLRAALERTLRNFVLLLQRFPVRDVDETIAEANRALAASLEETP